MKMRENDLTCMLTDIFEGQGSDPTRHHVIPLNEAEEWGPTTFHHHYHPLHLMVL